MQKKLPILPILVAAIDLCRAHFSYLVKITAPWFVIILIAPYALSASTSPDQTVSKSITMGSWDITLNFTVGPWGAILLFLYVFCIGSIAVLWHCRVLRAGRQSGKTIAFDHRVWNYLFRGLLILTIVVGCIVLLVFLSFIASRKLSEIIDDISFFYVSTVCLLIVSGIVAARLSIALPATALDVHGFGLRRAWNATTNNGFRLFVVTALPFIPYYVFTWAVEAISGEQADVYVFTPLAILADATYQLLGFAVWLFGLSILSLTYAFFVESQETDFVPQT